MRAKAGKGVLNVESRRIWDGIREARKEPLEDWLGIKHRLLLDVLQEIQVHGVIPLKLFTTCFCK